jgi:hypothetical protein
MVMQREVLDGVPFWCDKENKVYAYDTSPGVGSPSPESILDSRKNSRRTLRVDAAVAAYFGTMFREMKTSLKNLS